MSARPEETTVPAETTAASTATVPQESPRPATAARKPMVLVLVGSPKPRGSSTSESLGRMLLERLGTRGVEGRVAYAHAAGTNPDSLLAAAYAVDLIVLATPLYFDALPSGIVQALGRLAAHRRAHDSPALALAALVNCGTPDARQAEPALRMCALAARDAGLQWLGGLAFGEGDAIGGRHPSRLGTERLVAALDLAAEALALGQPVPDEAVAIAAQPLMPEGRYALLVNTGWLMSAGRNRALLRVADRPMEEPRER